MVPFLFVISFIMHLVTLSIIILLYRQNKLIDTKEKDEFEQMFERYLVEIREENDRLQNLSKVSLKPHVQNKQKEVEYEPLIVKEQEVQDELETSLTANILSLSEKGYTPTEIAQKLHCGKTEAELIIKFHEEKTHKA